MEKRKEGNNKGRKKGKKWEDWKRKEGYGKKWRKKGNK